MLKRNESVLTDKQKDSLKIKDFIFHIIDPDNPVAVDGVITLDEVVLTASQHKFFQTRLRNTASGNKYVFLRDAVALKDKCVAIISKSMDFLTLSRQITSDFAGRHKGNMSAGVFVVATVEVTIDKVVRTLIFLVKLDHKKTINVAYAEKAGRRVAVVTDLPSTLTESQSAVSKSALIDVQGTFSWDALAWDRTGTERQTRLSQYFEGFLGVGVHGTPAALTETAYKAARQWVAASTSLTLPEALTKQVVKDRALDYLKGNSEFNTDAFIKAVLRDEVENLQELRNSFSDFLSEVGVAGQTFKTELRGLQPKERKTIYKTGEGVTIQYEDGAGQSVVDVKWQDPQTQTGPAVITIRTDDLTVNE